MSLDIQRGDSMTRSSVSGIVRSSHRLSQAEMIDQKINQLCEDTGLIKKRLLENIGLYQELYASRMRHRGLRQEEASALLQWLHKKGSELEKFKPSDDPILTIEELHQQFSIWKTKLVQPIGTSYRTLERRKEITDQQKQALKAELLKIAKHLKEFEL